ncbi:hypothetical protein CYMTET_5389 [Cymbomonas tetramitiformis]|uniref:ATP-grasp domain-containing protein n=1 Tax=Cymbomonas tetramitiformis TaxID=36881 RepID=A0AAE0LIX8_9CHLO|nr:hypothetical protein CYMTET_5389 [Cymbomonas tetramitiformis]|eukprot:gene20064-24022_t
MADSLEPCIAVLAGGFNEERALSLQGGQDVLDALSKNHANVKFIDWTHGIDLHTQLVGATICFNCLHGSLGEDGAIAGLLETMQIPYTFSGIFGSACGSDKGKSKDLLSGKRDVLVVPGEHVLMSEYSPGADCPIPLPVMVKDPTQGSSKGVWLCKNKHDVDMAMAQVAGPEALVEQFIAGVDIVVCLIQTDAEVIAWPVMEFETELEWQDNASKNSLWGWERGSEGKPTVLKHCPPKNLSQAAETKAVAMAKAIYRHLRARGALNVEFRVSGEDIYFIEVSVIPALTKTSVHATCAKAGDLSYSDLIEQMVKTASLDCAKSTPTKL